MKLIAYLDKAHRGRPMVRLCLPVLLPQQPEWNQRVVKWADR